MSGAARSTDTATVVTRLTLPLALVIGFAPVMLYWTVSYVQLAAELEGNLKIQAVVLTDFVARQPDTWDVATDRLLGTLDRFVSYENGFSVLKATGEVVAAVAPTQSGPFLVRDVAFHAFGRPVGRLIGRVSLRHELLIGLAVLGVSLTGAWLVWGPLRRIPLAALAAAEADLRTRDVYQRALLDNFPFLVWLKDTERRFLAVNAKFLEVTGLASETMVVGKSGLAAAGPGLAALCLGPEPDPDGGGPADDKPRRVETWVDHGVARRCFEVYTSTVFLKGQRAGTVGYAQDITARKASEEAVRRSQELERILARISSELIGLRFETLGETLPPLLDSVGAGIGAGQTAVHLLVDTASPQLLSRHAGTDPSWAPALGDGQPHLQAWIVSRLRQAGTLRLHHDQDLPPEAAREWRQLEERGVRSLLAVPLTQAEALLGLMEIASPDGLEGWTPEGISFVETVARVLANGIEAARLERSLRYNERRYLDLIENLTEGLCAFDSGGRVTFLNKSMAAMLGCPEGTLPDQEAGRPVVEAVAQALREKHRASLEGTPATHAFELVRRDGQRLFVSASISPVRDLQGDIVGTMALVSDLTKERILQVKLLHAQRLEALGQLAAGIAHEINTPTQYVDNNAHFLKGAFNDLLALLGTYDALLEAARGVAPLAGAVGRVEAARRQYQVEGLLAEVPGAFHDIAEGVQRIALIVNSVKRFAHPSQDALQAADLNEALRSTIVVAKNEWRYVAEVATAFDPDLPPVPCVLSDINQVVLNLIVNAAHAIAAAPERPPEAKGLITVRTRVEDGWAVIEVQDTGTGIPAAIRSRVFDPFFTTKEVGRGTGQGLAISRTVVEDKHHGAITFETEEGKGTTFLVRLPLVQAEPEAGS